MIKAPWLESTDKNVCLCCGQLVYAPVPMTPERAWRALRMFEALGLTREDLLGKHREQIDYQSPGFSEWLQGERHD
jgi:hypothetical protein